MDSRLVKVLDNYYTFFFNYNDMTIDLAGAMLHVGHV